MPITKIDEVNLYYEVRGDGTPILFIHPPLITSRIFKYQIDGLSNTFKTVVFDIQGHGNSTFSKKPLTYPLISNDIKHILDHLGIEKAFICGYSSGGSIALDFVFSYPNRTLGAILIGAMSEVNDWVLRKQISLAVFLSNPKTKETLTFSICLGNSNNNDIFKDLFREAKKGNIKNIKQYFQYSLNYNCTSKLDKIEHPVILLYGEKDKGFRHYAHIINQKLPHNELVFVRNGKHQLPTKSSKEVNHSILNFINKQD